MTHKFVIIWIFFPIYAFTAKIGFIHCNYYGNGDLSFWPKCLNSYFTKAGHTIEGTNYLNADRYDLIVSMHPMAHNHLNHFQAKKIAKKTIKYCYEPPIVDKQSYNFKLLSMYRRIFTFDHSHCKNKQSMKMFYPWLENINQALVNKALTDPEFAARYNYMDIIKLTDKFIPFQNRNLSCLINSIMVHSYSTEHNYFKRLQVAKFYNKHFPHKLTLYGGRGWNNYNISIYKGECSSKELQDTFRSHKFSYCYDNWNNDIYYISEKIQRCFNNLCVPIYRGCNNITDFIPENTFIDANKFSSIREIHEYISAMDEETWMGYINAIREFVLSDDSYVFTKEYHCEQMVKTVNEVLEEMGISK